MIHLVKVGSYWIDPARIVYLEEIDGGNGYLKLEGDHALALLPEEVQALVRAVKPPMPPGWGRQGERRGDA